MTVILSSGSLLLLALGSLLLVTNSAHTIDIQPAVLDPSAKLAEALNDPNPVGAEYETSTMNSLVNGQAPDARRRNGRVYSRSSYDGSQQASSIDNYAAAYGAVSSPTSNQDQSSPITQTGAQANDASSYASFGESLPSSASSSVSSGSRQFSGAEYSAAHSPYYANYMSPSSNAASFSGQQSASSSSYPMHSMAAANHYPSHYSKGSQTLPMGYPTNGFDRSPLSSYYDRSYLGAASSPLWASSASSGGLMSSASTALSHWAGGFSIGEILCGIIAIAIGAVILGAPFFLIYLALVGNFSGSGTLSLTNPTGGATPAGGAAATVNGRRKRLAIYEQLNSPTSRGLGFDFSSLADTIVNRISPHVDIEQVATTFKKLINSIEKYSTPVESNSTAKNNSTSHSLS